MIFIGYVDSDSLPDTQCGIIAQIHFVFWDVCSLT